jgi:phosphohistidine phosphatase
MKTLLLLRHADTARKEPGGGDHERGLSQAGRSAARRLGEWLAQQGTLPTQVVCSSARRARDTLEALALPRAEPGSFRFERELYLASADTLLDRVAALGEEPGGTDCALLVGHNPGIADLAEWLAAGGEPAALERLRRGFPPAALAVLTLDVPSWSAISPRCGRLATFTTPAEVRNPGGDGS